MPGTSGSHNIELENEAHKAKAGMREGNSPESIN